MGKQKCREKKGTAKDPKHTATSVKHGGGVVMAWACMAAAGTGPLNFTDDLKYHDNSRINLLEYKTILLSRCTGEPGTRRRGTSLEHFIFHTEIAGNKYTYSMTLRLNTEAGKHRAYKGETKLDNE